MSVPVAVGECIQWEGLRDRNGYGRRRFRGRSIAAHRFAYIEAHGDIPDGLQLHHACHNKGCVNVAHLIPVTPKEHKAIHVAEATKATHCHRGHEFTDDNTYVRNDGSRECRQCSAVRKAAYKARQREMAVRA